MKECAAALLLLLCLCSAAFGQTPDAVPGAPDFSEMRQVATYHATGGSRSRGGASGGRRNEYRNSGGALCEDRGVAR